MGLHESIVPDPMTFITAVTKVNYGAMATRTGRAEPADPLP